MTVAVDHLLGPEGPIARRLDRFEDRPQQRAMAEMVMRTLDAKSHLMVEAGTGVGKSFAYLVPAIKRIVDHDERIVVVTNTINLQEQILEKDLPLLNAVIPEEFSAVLVKGRGNYVSLRRLKLASERQERLFTSESSRHALHELEDWAYQTTDGTLSSLPQLPRMDVWDYAQSDSNNCMGRKCPYYKECFYQAARRRMEHGDLLICNHALFFSDLALRMSGVGFLPPYDHVILDEAHAVEEVASDHFGLSMAESRVNHLLRLLYDARRRKGFLATLSLKDGSTQRIDEAIRLVLDLWVASDQQFAALLGWHAQYGQSNGRITQRDIVDNFLTEPMAKLSQRLRLLKEQAKSEADAYELNSYATRAAEIARHAEILIGQQIDGCVYFLDGADLWSSRGGSSEGGGGAYGDGDSGGGTSRRRGRGRRLSLKCMAVDVSPILREHLFGQDLGIVLTSATLATTAGDFTHTKKRLGCEGMEAVQLGSPFEHGRQMRVVVDRQMPEPRSPQYVDMLIPRIERLVQETDGGAFVLFTSFAMLRKTAAAMRGPLAEEGHPVLVQGDDGPPGLLLKRFRENRRSVLFGTSSFWQGVDVQGDGLRNVIITRLPFEVPDRPIVEARQEQIEADGGHPFMEDQVPRAVIRFRQGIGRLIRSHDDRGLVAVLDPRIVTKSYGRLFQAALPEDVRAEPIEALDE